MIQPNPTATIPLSPSEIDLMGYEGGTPAPLAPLQHVIVSKEDAELEGRRENAIVLSRREFTRIARRVEKLEAYLRKRGYAEFVPVYRQARNDVQAVIDHYLPGELPTWKNITEVALKLENDDKSTLPVEWETQLAALRKYAKLTRAIAPLRPMISEYARLRHDIEDHWLALERKRVQAIFQKKLKDQCRWYEQLILEKWQQLGYYEKVTLRRGREYIIRPQFSDVRYSIDRHHFKIDAMRLPKDVRVVSHLLAPETLDELTLACQRQVVGEFDPRSGSAGAWLIINRNEAVDGLMNYVTYDDVMSYYRGIDKAKIPLCIGVGENRRVKYLNLSEFPHWLIAGVTGAGKSNLANVLISTLITQFSPNEVRLVLVDMKGGLEFDSYAGIPHLHGRIVTNIDDAVDMLGQLEAIMRLRFKKFRGVAKSIEAYHRAFPDDYMPHLVCFIDEIAEFSERGEISKRSNQYLREITRLARAVGIHIIACTQRPDVQAISGSVKANLAVRIAFSLPSPQDSMTILGNAAATKIAAIKGRALAQIGNWLRQLQTPHMTEEMNQRSIDAAKSYPMPPQLDLPQLEKQISAQWTIERIIQLSLEHLNGNITWKPIYEAAEGLTQSEARRLVEQIWSMPEIEYSGQKFTIAKGKGHEKRLKPVA